MHLPSISESKPERLPDVFVDNRRMLAASWQRCVDRYQLDPTAKQQLVALTEGELRTHLEPFDDVLQAVEDELHYVSAPLSAAGFSATFANNTGLILRYRSDRDSGNYVESERPGTIWAEGVAGTNGLGTCLIERRPVHVYKNQHFFKDFAHLSCASVPVLSADAAMIGVLTFCTGNPHIPEDTFRLVCGLASKAAERVSNQVFRRRFRDKTILKLTLTEFDRTVLIAVDEAQQIVGTNRGARNLLSWVEGEAPPQDLWTVFEPASGQLRGQALDGSRVTLRHRGNDTLFDIENRPPAKVQMAGSQLPESPAAPRKPASIALKAPRQSPSVEECIGTDPRMSAHLRLLGRVNGSNLPILILGETGVGKDTLARALHNEGPRRDRPFVPFNCAAVPETLIDSELFGYSVGAFTGARREGNAGRLMETDGGTLFLDEIGDMPLVLQTRLLRVLESGEITPLGSGRIRHIDVQVIAATNQELSARVAEGRFREDLYYRLAGVVIEMLPLRQRRDLPDLIQRMLKRSGGGDITLTDAAVGKLLDHRWPGNARELKYVLQRAVQICDGRSITPEDLMLDVSGTDVKAAKTSTEGGPPSWGVIGAAERSVLIDTLAQHAGEIDKAAQALNISRATLYRKMKTYDIGTRRVVR